MKRRKTAALPVPQTREEALRLIGDYAVELERLAAENAAYDTALARLKKSHADGLADIEAKARPLFDALAAWFSANRQALTAGQRRSVELAGMILGERRTPPALKLPRGMKPEEAIALLIAADRCELVRVSYALDKEAIVRLLTAPEGDAAIAGIGLAAESRDEFFIQPKEKSDA